MIIIATHMTISSKVVILSIPIYCDLDKTCDRSIGQGIHGVHGITSLYWILSSTGKDTCKMKIA